MILSRYKRNQFRKIQKNQRRGTSGSSVTSFLLMILRLSNNQKGRVYSLRGIRGGCNTIHNYLIRKWEETYVVSFSFLVPYYKSWLFSCTLAKQINFFIFLSFLQTKSLKQSHSVEKTMVFGDFLCAEKRNPCIQGFLLMRHRGFEPRTTWLKVKCSTDWANTPYSFVVP